jgi:hypothetical protein
MLVENIKTEKDVFTALGLQYIKPQDRYLTGPASALERKKRDNPTIVLKSASIIGS